MDRKQVLGTVAVTDDLPEPPETCHTMSNMRKTERLALRVEPDELGRIRLAAATRHVSPTEAARVRADDVLMQRTVVPADYLTSC